MKTPTLIYMRKVFLCGLFFWLKADADRGKEFSMSRRNNRDSRRNLMASRRKNRGPRRKK